MNDQLIEQLRHSVSLIKEKKFTEAEAFLRDMSVSFPDEPMVWNNLGFALAKSKRRKEAKLYFNQALKLDPKHKLAKRNKRAFSTGYRLSLAGIVICGFLVGIGIAYFSGNAISGYRQKVKPDVTMLAAYNSEYQNQREAAMVGQISEDSFLSEIQSIIQATNILNQNVQNINPPSNLVQSNILLSDAISDFRNAMIDYETALQEGDQTEIATGNQLYQKSIDELTQFDSTVNPYA